MTIAQILAAFAAAKGRIITVSAAALPATEAQIASRKRRAALHQSAGRAIGRVITEGIADDGGALVRISGRIDRAWGDNGIATSKSGSASISLVISAPEEYGMATYCPNAGREGTACVKRAPRHAHRSIRVDRISAITCGGEALA
jgi:hypothetical protein